MFGYVGVNLARHDEIKRKLRSKGVRLIDIAVATSRQPSQVTQVLQGYRKNAEIEQMAAFHLGVDVDALFPERYPSKATDKEN
ncbi:helix-turn-helix domain-containing protein [Paracoccus caeni]|uniref:Helix-turn-helix domain-containing protein n=1 Tax=Paracoccus caeni TaxID=657651 RepID=A0A934VTG9_9RHOB|nr:helix-turn-helix domain-containing protein [Paracoccus caeni]MBK4214711.1 helix-turn-helix domain-containing protein [Paracoccus caeni]